MTATQSWAFAEKFVLRPANYHDLALADAWTAADPDHAGRVDPTFWLMQRPWFDSYLLLDDVGAVFFLAIESPPAAPVTRVELHIQFRPPKSDRDRARIRDGLQIGFPWLARRLRGVGVTEVFFRSATDRLVVFCVKRLGFVREGELLKKAIA